MVVDVYVGPCSDPGSTPGVSTNLKMESIFILSLAIIFGWLLLKSKKTHKRLNQRNRDLVDRIKNRDK